MTAKPLLDVRELRTEFDVQDGVVHAVNGVSFSLGKGESLGIVGESGSGKSATALSILRLIPEPPGRVEGEVWFDGMDLVRATPAELSKVRGRGIGMVFQDPMTSLNPAMRVSRQISEGLEFHMGLKGDAARTRAIELLEMVGIPAAHSRVDDYPHQFSGGMRQRVIIAIALSCDPQILIADEPTTALDVTIQAQILDVISRLRRELGMAAITISHDLGVVANVAEQIGVMYAGRFVEYGTRRDVLKDPRHPYTLGLLRSIPRLDQARSSRLIPIEGMPPDLSKDQVGCPFVPRCPFSIDRCSHEDPPLERVAQTHRKACWVDVDRTTSPLTIKTSASTPDPQRREEVTVAIDERSSLLLDVADLRVHFPVKSGILQRQVGSVKAVDGVSFSIRRGETLGLVGESGSGKSTTGRAILQLRRPTSGSVNFLGRDLTQLDQKELRHTRRHMQMVFQDPYGSLDPRKQVGEIVGAPIQLHGLAVSRRELDAKVSELLEIVGLDPRFSSRHPHEFSGGQRQRIGIARVLGVRPSLVVCDEPVSALDVSIQAQIVNLLEDLQEQYGLTYLFIAHDLSVVRHISHRIAVMYLGQIAEIAGSDVLYQRPLHPYTMALLSSVPVPDPDTSIGDGRILLQGEIPSPVDPPSGCRFRTRCPFAQPLCSEIEPKSLEVEPEHFVACHFWAEIEDSPLSIRWRRSR